MHTPLAPVQIAPVGHGAWMPHDRVQVPTSHVPPSQSASVLHSPPTAINVHVPSVHE